MRAVNGDTRRSVIALLASSFLSVTASTAFATVIGKQVFDLTGRVLDLGLLGLAQFAPALLLVMVTGTVADRFDRRSLAAGGLGVEALTLGVVAWYAGTRPTSVIPIYVLVVALGTAQAFVTPALRSLPADSVPAERLPWLVARQAAAWQAAFIAGPVLGGFLYVVDIRLPYAVASGLALATALAVSFVRARPAAVAPARPVPERGRGQLGEAAAGFRFVRSQPVVLGAISLDLFAVLFGGAVALLPAIAEKRLGVGAVGLGWLRASIGIGASLVTLFLAARPVTRSVGRTLLVSVAAFGAGTIVLGITTSYAVAFVALMALSGADAVSAFIRSTLVPLVTPSSVRGRVLAVESVFIGASNQLGAFESGVTGQLLGAGPAVALGGAATLVVAVLWWRVFPALRGVDHFPREADLVA